MKRKNIIFYTICLALVTFLAICSTIYASDSKTPANDLRDSKPVKRFLAAGIQTANQAPHTRKELEKNLDRMLESIEGAMGAYGSFGFPLKLIVFPELAIHGVPYIDPKDYWKNDLLVTIPGPETDVLVQLAKKYNIYIVPGSWLEKDPAYPAHIFNTSFIVGPEGVLLKYRKINNWESGEFMFSSPHRINGYNFKKDPAFPVVKTPIGTLGLAICYDLIFPEVTRELTMKGAEIIIRTSAYMYPFSADPPMNWWTTVSQVRSLENVVYGIHVNLGSTLKETPPFSFGGGSSIVDYEGRIVSQILNDGEHTVLGTIDIESLREWRANTYLHAMPAQIRSEVYTYLQSSWLPQGTVEKNEYATQESSKKAIDEGRRRVWGTILKEHKRKNR